MTAEFKSRVQFIALVSAVTIACATIAWHARFLVLLLFAGCLFALLLQTLAAGLQKLLKIRYRMAYALILLAGGAALGSFVWLRGPALARRAAEVGALLPDALKHLALDVQRSDWGTWLSGQVVSQTDISRAVSFVLTGIGGATLTGFALLGGIFIVFLVGVYVAAEPQLYRERITSFVPERRRALFEMRLAGALRNLRYWLFARAISMTIIGSVVAIGLWLLRVPLAGTLGLIAALLTFIPNLGPILSAVPAVLLAFVVSPLHALSALLVLCAAHFLEGNLVTPLLDRGIVKLPPALTLTTQCLLGSVAGIVGIALAAPILACTFGFLRAREFPPANLVQVGRPLLRSFRVAANVSRRADLRTITREGMQSERTPIPIRPGNEPIAQKGTPS